MTVEAPTSPAATTYYDAQHDSPGSFVNAYDGLSGTMGDASGHSVHSSHSVHSGYASGHSPTRGASFARGSSPYASSSAASIGRQPGSHPPER